MSRVYHKWLVKPLIPRHLSTHNDDMCHNTIGSGLIEIESNHDWNYDTQ